MNRALKDLGCAVSLELSPSGRTIRLRGTLPTPEGKWTRQRISTPLPYPAGLEQGRQLAEQLGRDLQLHRMGIESFPFERWKAVSAPQGKQEAPITGLAAIKLTEKWWQGQRKRGGSALTTWAKDYAEPLAPLLNVQAVNLESLKALVICREPGSRSRRRAALAASAAAQSLELGLEAVQQIRALGKGYSPQKDAAPRDLPSDAVIIEVIDQLPSDWQWVAGVCATYGARPHEALLMAEVQSNGLVSIAGGKTGARQGLPLPKEWITRWSLKSKRLPKINLERDHRTVGSQLGVALRRYAVPFRAYDLRHAWAVRAIHNPQLSPSLAAKSLGHSLMVHTSLYQRWFDSASMASLVAQM